MGYSPWGYKESDMTKQLTHTHTQERIMNTLSQAFSISMGKDL